MIKEKKYNKLLNNIGKITEKDSSIVIDVDNDALKKMLKKTGNILLINSKSIKESSKPEISHVKFNGKTVEVKSKKPIIYHINNMDFENITICTDENVIFTNCNFIGGVNILKANSLIFINNNYMSLDDKYNESFFRGQNIKSIIFYDENITDQNVAFRIKAREIQLLDTVLLDENGHTNFNCEVLQMNNSTIGGKTSFIEAETLAIAENSQINNTDNCIIETVIQYNDLNKNNAIKSPRIIYNGTLFMQMDKKKTKSK